jgi:RNA polymerase sigma-70 factor (ECF subfamily)
MQSDEERRRRFEVLAAEMLEPVRRYLARRTDRATAEDVLSDVLLVCWRRLDEMPPDPLPWVVVVARNCLRNAERGARRRKRLAARLADGVGADGRSPEPSPEALTVREALSTLRPAEAELLRLWAWEGLAPQQLATVLGISANAAAIRLHRAKRSFAAALAAANRTGPEAERPPAAVPRAVHRPDAVPSSENGVGGSPDGPAQATPRADEGRRANEERGRA